MQNIHNQPIPLVWKLAVKEVFGPDTEIKSVLFFSSKKNQVSLLELEDSRSENRVVAKKYVWGDADAEFTVLSRAFELGLAVPRPIAKVAGIVFMEPVSGVPCKTPLTAGTAAAAGEWLRKFHALMTVKNARLTFLRGDCMPQNFVLDGKTGSICGVDFEQACFGHPELDISEMISAMLADPACADRAADLPALETAACFLRGYSRPLEAELLFGCLAKDIESRCGFRPELSGAFSKALESLERRRSEILQIFRKAWEA